LDQRSNELAALVRRHLAVTRRKWETAGVRLEERSPFQLLERGYAIAYDAQGRVLRSAAQVGKGDDISVRLARGQVGARVTTKTDG
jgi:exodeoxyribonuclease VII large subunit